MPGMPGHEDQEGDGEEDVEGDEAEAKEILGAVEGPDEAEEQGSEEEKKHEGEGDPAAVETGAPFVNVEDDAAFPEQNPGDGVGADAVNPEKPAVVGTAVYEAEVAAGELDDDEY